LNFAQHLLNTLRAGVWCIRT